MAYKLLSLDGGGSWAVLQLLTILDRYGNINGHNVLKKFDLVAANSGGSIVLAALCENWKIEQAIDLFRKKDLRNQIFSKNKFKERFFPVDYLRLLNINIGPKYSSKRKKEAFERLFPVCNSHRLKQIPDLIGKKSLKIIICTYDALNNKSVFFKSFKNEKYFDDVTLVQAIHASSNAPIQYFDFPARFKAKESEVFYDLWDGALGGFNNPSVVAVNEAIQAGVPCDNLSLISLGTGNIVTSMYAKEQYYKSKDTAIRFRHKKFNFRKIGEQLKFFSSSVMQQAKTILYQPPDWSNEISSTLIFGRNENYDKSRFIRLSPLIYCNENTSDEINNLIDSLSNLDMDLTSEKEIEMLMKCYMHWKNDRIYNQPITYRVNREGAIDSSKGTLRYTESMDEWKKYDM